MIHCLLEYDNGRRRSGRSPALLTLASLVASISKKRLEDAAQPGARKKPQSRLRAGHFQGGVGIKNDLSAKDQFAAGRANGERSGNCEG